MSEGGNRLVACGGTQDIVHHSHLSFLLNVGLLAPLDDLHAAERGTGEGHMR